MAFTIEFLSITTMLPGERNSKLLNPESELVRSLSRLRGRFRAKYGANMSAERPWHIELNRRWYPTDGSTTCVFRRVLQETEGKVLSRAATLQGQTVDPSAFVVLGKALVLTTPSVEGYGPTHITIAHFPAGVPTDASDLL